MVEHYHTYMLVSKVHGVWYSPPASNAADCWNNAEQWEMWIQGGRDIGNWKERMKKNGFRAKIVVIEHPHGG